ncbi:CPCC family cysteine-rich protein [Pseudomonas sp. R11F]|uniref:CPCC family cysteine-rich protein n=1 Tax=Pseudomonas TaxID=286 RepID=UPI00398E6BA5
MYDIPCPCCGFLTFRGAYGSYNVCALCDWEDDGVQLANPTSDGGANSLSLADAQTIAISKYPENIGLVNGYSRSPHWRRMNISELQAANARKALEHWHTIGICEESEAYWSVTRIA